MTPSHNLKANKIALLEELAYDVAVLYADEIQGEQFHPEYKKNKALFKKIINSSIKLEKDLKKHFKQLAKDAPQKIEWGVYYEKLIKGSIYTRDINWEDELLQLQIIFENNLDDIFVYGGLAGQAEVGTTIGFSKYDTPTIRALKKYSLQLATGLTNTTKAKITESLKRSIQMGLDQEQASLRLNKIIDDPYRAGMIAHTEAVNAYTQGKLEVGERIGAKYKVWFDGQKGACPTCVSLHGKVVGLKGMFKDENGNEYIGTPAHPWCRCLTKLAMDETFIENILGAEDTGWRTGKGGQKYNIFWSKGKIGKGTNGVGYNYKQITGTSLKRANTIVTHEGTDRSRVSDYIKLIKSGHKISPIYVVKEKDGSWGVHDGKHRFSALKKLKHEWIATVTQNSKAYGEATEIDDKAIQAMKK